MSTEQSPDASKPMKMVEYNKKTLVMVIVALVVAFGVFYAGAQYEKAKLNAASKAKQTNSAAKKAKAAKKANPTAEQTPASATTPDTTTPPTDTTTPQDTTGSDSSEN